MLCRQSGQGLGAAALRNDTNANKKGICKSRAQAMNAHASYYMKALAVMFGSTPPPPASQDEKAPIACVHEHTRMSCDGLLNYGRQTKPLTTTTSTTSSGRISGLEAGTHPLSRADFSLREKDTNAMRAYVRTYCVDTRPRPANVANHFAHRKPCASGKVGYGRRDPNDDDIRTTTGLATHEREPQPSPRVCVFVLVLFINCWRLAPCGLWCCVPEEEGKGGGRLQVFVSPPSPSFFPFFLFSSRGHQ